MAKPIKRPKTEEKFKKPITLLFVIGSFLALVYLYYSRLPIFVSFPLAIIVLIITGMVVSTANGLPGSYGLYMLGGRKGIGIIDNLSKKNRAFWKAFAEWGMVLSFGLLSYVVLRKRMDIKVLIFGILCLLGIMIIILPNAFLALRFISIPKLSTLGIGATSFQPPALIYPVILYVIAVLGGFFIFIVALLALEAFGVLSSIGVAALGAITGHPNTAALSQQIPGVVPVIPGITIPFFAGVFALAVLLIVHEFSHGVFARRARIKIRRIGLILFGIIPVGAFVEPDEKEVARLDKNVQNEIFIAGISANFLFTIIFFALTAVMIIYAIPIFFQQGVVVASAIPGYPAYNVIAPGSIILTWNGHSILNISSFDVAAKNDTAFSTVSVMTNKGSYTFQTNSTGKIGVYVAQTLIAKKTGPQDGLINFLYSFFALSFVLNFFVATINLLPIPAFDGWRIYKNRIKNRKILIGISALTLIGIIIIALPWLWA